MLVLLDTNILTIVVHPNTKVSKAITNWLIDLHSAEVEVKVPEICDYELRRQLILINSSASINKLDQFNQSFGYIPFNTDTIRLASQLWADIRRSGKPTTDDKSLDGDVLLAAQAIMESNKPEYKTRRVVVATNNLKDLRKLTDADRWENIKP